MSLKQHGLRIVLLLVLAGALLGWLSAHTEVLFADGLRYVRQAQTIARGAWSDGLLRAVDHPVYPLEIALAHRLVGGTGPDSWQQAAQVAAVVAGIFLVVPLYLVACELFGAEWAWLGCALAYAVPLTGHVFADALSESTFLLFWTWGIWTALRFLRAGQLAWLPATMGLAALAYLSRPEGLLLPLALVATLGVLPCWRSLAFDARRWLAALAVLVIVPAGLIGPYVAIKGGIGTKPSIARLLGTAPKSPPQAVERQHPLDPGQTSAETWLFAARAVCEAIRDAVSIPLLPMALVGLLFLVRRELSEYQRVGWGRGWLFVAIVSSASILALLRLHATGGYCSPRHALVLSLLLIPAAGAGIGQTIAILRDAAARHVPDAVRSVGGPALWALVLVGLSCTLAPRTLAPLNEGLGGYRRAGLWLRAHGAPGVKVVDVTGWSLFYGELPGYTFATLPHAAADPAARWVVAREAHLRGPWPYCAELRGLIGELAPAVVFSGANPRHPTKVFIFERLPAAAALGAGSATPVAGAGRSDANRGTSLMRIAWFTHRYHPCIGGAETYGRAMVRRFIADGHEADVFTSDAHELAYYFDRRKRRVDAAAESLVDGARVRRFAVRHLPLQRYAGKLLSYVPHWPTQCRRASYMPILPGIERVRGDYDVVFGVGFPFTIFSYAALRTVRAAGAPLVLTPFLHLATPGDAVHRSYTRPHQVRLLAAADLIVVPTALEARAIQEWGIKGARILHMPMAIEHAEVTGGNGAQFRARFAIPSDCSLVGQLGALDQNKGSADLVRAVERLNETRPENSLIHLVLAGAPTPDFDTFAAALPARTARWLKIVGPLPAADVPSFYAALDVFSMPSRTDSFGIVFLEAWANALPVVAAAAGGVVEVVQHDRNGLLVPFGDIGRLAGALGRLLDDRSLARSLGECGHDQVTRGYTWEERYATLKNRIQTLLEDRRPVRIGSSQPSSRVRTSTLSTSPCASSDAR